jgi:2-polyprenyl-3-methyl-5-hydroxy-6-metoxy-1,4-benzoquinol methylase
MKHEIKGKRAFSNDLLLGYLMGSIEHNTSVLDLGCGPKLYSDPLKPQCSQVVTVDGWEWVEPDIVANLESTSLTGIVTEKFDYILMLDFIEHLDKDQGLRLIEECKSVVNKKIFLLTPMASIWTENHENVDNPDLWCYGNTYDIHKSLWAAEDFVGFTRIHLRGLEHYYVGFYAA